MPFAARWPYAVDVRPAFTASAARRPRRDAALELARLLAAVLDRFDGLWGFDLPYMLCVQEAPAADGLTGAAIADWHLHVELLPPHRNPDRLKVRASVETDARRVHQRHLPEHTAAALRGVERAPRLDRRRAAGDRAGAVTDVTARAPGRVNLIGDHTDYTGGFCFPIAISQGITVTGRRTGERIRIRSDTEATVADMPIDSPIPPLSTGVARYVAAVVDASGRRSDSTSRSRPTCHKASAFRPAPPSKSPSPWRLGPTLRSLCSPSWPRRRARRRQVPTGILDQLASIFGRAGHGLLIDCCSLDVTGPDAAVR